MPTNPYWMLLLLALGCSAPHPNVRVRQLANGMYEVEGPLAGPFKTREELAQVACERMIQMPGASTLHGRQGKEYCALWYYSPQEQAYFLSYFSDLGGDGAGGRKYCKVPLALRDANTRDPVILGPAHPHPHNWEFSREDMGANHEPDWSPWGSARFVDRSGRIWEHELRLFYGPRNGGCLAYDYNYSSRVVSALRSGRWIPIGKASGTAGDFSFDLFEGQSWLP
ncbi:hypothetical protein [Corallococcus exiguus]|uniref:Uncharacterized protein n=1 Tax=Corallococcus exiguus TaxID=83462 RepID=A0A7X4Y5N4_9BACT|nr:hypothetical protein [Corallococcus exiguus]NBC39011.1 hypothetical protein [Corallococcus exiguus]TNV67529.1 hypothetical protein FH620_00545 [Corallococcus exiguus]